MRHWWQEKKQASISLTVVIIVVAILLSTGMTVLLVNIDLGFSAKDYLNYQLNMEKTQTCLEEVLNRINLNVGYTGNFSVAFTDGSCGGTVALHVGNANLRDVSLTSTTGTYSFAINRQIDISASPYKVINQ